MKDACITIAMPVYNSGKYLDKSIGSLLSQTYPDFELYCIDDASTDEATAKKLDYYAQKDNRVKVKHLKENIGPGAACNLVIECAEGEYFIRLDSDDVYDFDMLEKMVIQIRRFDADVCVSGMRLFSDNNNEVVEEWLPMKLPDELGINSSFRLTDIKKDNALSYSASSACNKLVKISLLISSEIRFAGYRYYEDAIYADRVSLHADRIVYANERKPLMSYRRDVSGQLTDNPNTKEMLQYVSDLWNLERDVADGYKMRMLQHRYIRRFLKGINCVRNENKRREFYQIAQNFAREEMKENYLTHTNPKHAVFINSLIELPFETEWYIDENVFLSQLYLNQSSLIDVFSKQDKIAIFGNGKRSNALQKFLKHYKKYNVLVTDQNPEVIKMRMTNEGFDLVDKGTITQMSCIVASNHEIYLSLVKDYCDGLIDLESYCPIA